MTSLRRYVLIGAVLWTLGLQALWAVWLTFHRQAFQAIIVVHSYPHALMGTAILRDGRRVLRPSRAASRRSARCGARLAAVRAGTAERVEGQLSPAKCSRS